MLALIPLFPLLGFVINAVVGSVVLARRSNQAPEQ